MILDLRAATLVDADSVADVYLRSRKELVACAPLVHSDETSWIDQLYLLPGWAGCGIGTRLLELARSELLPPIRLYTFQCNQPARYFYEHRGFKAIAFGDGSGNEEKCPDILYEWEPRR